MEASRNLDALLAQTSWVRALSMDLLGDIHRADDVVQETLLTALEHPETKGMTGRRLRAWLGRVARNFARMSHRGESRRRHREHAQARPEAQPSAEESLELVELQQEIATSIMQLDSPDREIVALRYFDDCPPREIAKSLGLSPSTVHTRLHRARATLRETLDRTYGDVGRSWVLAAIGWARRPGPAHVAPEVALVAAEGTVAGGFMLKGLVSAAGIVTFLVALLIAQRLLGSRADEQRVAVVNASAELVDSQRIEAPTRSVEDARLAPTPTTRSAVPTVVDEPADATTLEPAVVDHGALGTVEVRVTNSLDGEPAPGIGLMVHPWSPDTWFHGRRGATDEDGVVRFQVPAGEVGVYIERLSAPSTFGAENVEVVSGETTRVAFEVVPGATVRGHVVDRLGQCVAGAEVWLGTGGGLPHEGQVVTTSDADGSFELRHVSSSQAVAARAAGLAPSLALMPIMHASKRTGENGVNEYTLDLVLPDVGGAIEGEVVDGAGQPLVDAIVLVGNGDPGKILKIDGSPAYEPPPARVRTDAEGRFRVEGTECGVVEVRTRTLGLDESRTEVNVPQGGVGHVRIVLRPAASVAGIVRRADGRAVEGARVSLAYGLRGLDRTHTTSGADGRFVLRGIPVGRQNLIAELPDESLSVEAELLTRSGAEEWWDATFPETLLLVGTLEDEHGSPLAGWRVQRETEGAESGQGEMDRASAVTDAFGTFEFLACPPHAQELSTKPPGQWLGKPVATLSGVEPGGAAVVLRVASDDVPSCGVRGLVVDAEGEPVPGAELELQARTPVFVHLGARTGADGRFEVRHLPAAGLRVTLSGDGYETRVLGELERLEPGELRDLGELTLVAAD